MEVVCLGYLPERKSSSWLFFAAARDERRRNNATVDTGQGVIVVVDDEISQFEGKCCIITHLRGLKSLWMV